MSELFKLDVRGLSCPEPVIRTKKALERQSLPLTILSDSFVSAENICRLVKSLGFISTTTQNADEFIITVTKEV